MEREIPVTQARADFAELVNRVVYGNERIVVTRHGRPLVALVSAADLDRLNALDAAVDAAMADSSGNEPSTAGVVRLTSSRRSVAVPPAASPAGPVPRYDVAARHDPPGRANRSGERR